MERSKMSLPPSCSQSAGETGNEGRAQTAHPCGLGLSWTERVSR